MSAQADRFAVSVPASSANLGPGFDAVGVALSLRMHASIEPAPRFALSFEPTEHAPSHDGLGALMRRAMCAVDPSLPPVHVRVANHIPLGKGLGSSAAAVVLALAVAMRARGARLDLRRIARVAAAIEGHPDNAFAAALGGAVIAADASHFLRFRCSHDIRPLLIVPAIDLDTHSARMLLPASYERADVMFNIQRAALLGAALASGELRCLREAMRDRLHQPYRAARIPGLREALAVRDRALAGVALSGAGPSLIACIADDDAIARVSRKLCAPFVCSGIGVRALPLRFSDSGIRIGPLAKVAAHAA